MAGLGHNKCTVDCMATFCSHTINLATCTVVCATVQTTLIRTDKSIGSRNTVETAWKWKKHLWHIYGLVRCCWSGQKNAWATERRDKKFLLTAVRKCSKTETRSKHRICRRRQHERTVATNSKRQQCDERGKSILCVYLLFDGATKRTHQPFPFLP